MTGFNIDPVALEGAIKQLKDIRSKARQLSEEAMALMPGELSAGDSVTQKAKSEFTKLASGPASLRTAALAMNTKLDEKIIAYEQTLEEYRRAEDSATIDASRIDRQQ